MNSANYFRPQKKKRKKKKGKEKINLSQHRNRLAWPETPPEEQCCHWYEIQHAEAFAPELHKTIKTCRQHIKPYKKLTLVDL